MGDFTFPVARVSDIQSHSELAVRLAVVQVAENQADQSVCIHPHTNMGGVGRGCSLSVSLMSRPSKCRNSLLSKVAWYCCGVNSSASLLAVASSAPLVCCNSPTTAGRWALNGRALSSSYSSQSPSSLALFCPLLDKGFVAPLKYHRHQLPSTTKHTFVLQAFFKSAS